jgi:putative toxin-antitoxin system antitoxin component (TIGR02293 family)
MGTRGFKPGPSKAAQAKRATTGASGLARAKVVQAREPKARAFKRASATDFSGVYELGAVERVALVKQGIPATEVSRVAKTIGAPKERLIKLLGLPRATVDRKARARQPLSIEHGERLIGFSKLVGQVQRMVEQSGDPTGFDAARWLGEWLDRPLPALAGKCPAEYMDTSEGQQMVSALLMRIQSGAYA